MKNNNFKKQFIILMVLSVYIESNVSVGEIEELYILKNSEERRIQIYTPSNLPINSDTKFIIMNDGQELFSGNETWNGASWKIDESFKKLSELNKNINIVVIAVDNAKTKSNTMIDDTKRYVEYFPKESIKFYNKSLRKNIYERYTNKEELNYPNFLAKTLIPFLEKRFEIQLNKSNLGIVGSSMGGVSALNTILEYPELFGFAGCLSTHWVGIKPIEYVTLPIRKRIKGDKATTLAIREYVENNINKISGQKLYFDHGTEGLDALYKKPQREINELLEKENIDFKSLVFEGHEHSPSDFGKRFNIMLEFLLDI